MTRAAWPAFGSKQRFESYPCLCAGQAKAAKEVTKEKKAAEQPKAKKPAKKGATKPKAEVRKPVAAAWPRCASLRQRARVRERLGAYDPASDCG